MNHSILLEYHEIIRRLRGLSTIEKVCYTRGKKRGPAEHLKLFESFLGTLQHPQKKLSYIHVTGTSGKGSVTAMLHEILRLSGKKVGSYSSPATTTLIERIRVNDLSISPESFIRLGHTVFRAAERFYRQKNHYVPSWFEMLMTIGFLYFVEQKCDIVCLEVGVGGRYDSSNVIPPPIAAIITNIGLDHAALLGDTKAKIASDKSGIIKKNSIVVTGDQSASLIRSFKRITRQHKGVFYHVPPPKAFLWKNSQSHGILADGTKITVPMLGAHQIMNAAIATQTSQALGIVKKFITRGIAKTRLPCRIEIMQKKPLVILDGAHNADKIHALRDAIRHLHINKAIVILTIADSQPVATFLDAVQPLAKRLFITRSLSEKNISHDLLTIQRLWIRKTNIPSDIFFNPFDALKTALALCSRDDAIIVTGSLYLAGEIRQYWISEAKILEKRKSYS